MYIRFFTYLCSRNNKRKNMTKYCLQARKKVYDLYLRHISTNQQNTYIEYSRAVQDFKERFHKRFDPLNLADDYDILGISSQTVNGKFIPLEFRN